MRPLSSSYPCLVYVSSNIPVVCVSILTLSSLLQPMEREFTVGAVFPSLSSPESEGILYLQVIFSNLLLGMHTAVICPLSTVDAFKKQFPLQQLESASTAEYL